LNQFVVCCFFAIGLVRKIIKEKCHVVYLVIVHDEKKQSPYGIVKKNQLILAMVL
jgi:hypothetical protein